MTNEELKALVESNARSIAALSNEASAERQRRSTNTDEIDTLLGAVSSNEVACRKLRQSVTTLVNAMAESNHQFNILRQEAIADRQTSDQRFEAQQEIIQTLLAQLIATNQDVTQAKGNISGLSDRIDGLEERAS